MATHTHIYIYIYIYMYIDVIIISIFIFIYTIGKQQTINIVLFIVYHNHILIIISLLYTIYIFTNIQYTMILNNKYIWFSDLNIDVK